MTVAMLNKYDMWQRQFKAEVAKALVGGELDLSELAPNTNLEL